MKFINIDNMSRHEVRFLYRRTELADSDLEYIGGYNSDNSQWKISIERAINGIEDGKWEFFIKKQNVEVNIVVKIINGSKKLCIDTLDFNYIEL